MSIKQVLTLLKNVKHTRNGWTARCPAHDDKHNSLSLKEGDNGQPIFFCHAKCEYHSILTALELKPRSKSKNTRKKIVAEYPYRDEQGQLLYQTVRFEPKGFSQRRPDGAGGFVWNLDSVRRVLYRLPELLTTDLAETIFICEGEKDCDRLAECGLSATTNAMGVSKWSDEYNEHLRDRNIVILPDNDDPGHHHAEQVAQSLNGIAASIKIAPLPNLPKKGDISDWLDASGTIEQLRALVEQTSLWQPQDDAHSDIEEGAEPKERRLSQATRLVELTTIAGVELFHTPDGKECAIVRVDDHSETMMLNNRVFKEWLAFEYFKSEGTTPNTQALKDALNTLSGKARFKGKCQEVFTRIAQYDETIYVDLCNKKWRIVEVNRDGWKIIEAHQCPLKFRRTRGMLPLSEPTRGGSLDALWEIINVAENARPLVAAYLVAAFRPGRPFPILALHGEQGSAKSTTARIIRSIIDPNVAPLRSEPRDVRDLMIASVNGWIVAFDNLSHIPSWLSDALCRLSTGGGFATRELYSDGEEVLFDALRPCLFTGIEELATRSDLLDRALIIYLPTISEEKRRPEKALMPEFEAARAGILGALLDSVSAALRNQEQVRLKRLPRMADFALWAVAAEEALGFKSGAFTEAYTGNREDINALALEASPIAAALRVFMEKRGDWEGTATDLLDALLPHVEESIRRQPSFPKKGNLVSNALRRLTPNLRASGITVLFHREANKSRRRLVKLINNSLQKTRVNDLSSTSSASSTNMLNQQLTPDGVADAELQADNESMVADAGRTMADTTPQAAKTLQIKANGNFADDADGMDGEILSFSDHDELLERAAIMEFDGGMIRADADKAAWAEFNDDLPF